MLLVCRMACSRSALGHFFFTLRQQSSIVKKKKKNPVLSLGLVLSISAVPLFINFVQFLLMKLVRVN